MPTKPSKSVNFEVAIVALLFMAFGFNYFTQSSDAYKYFNSDALTIYAFIADLLHFNGHISAWHFSNAPSFYPDYLIGLISSLLSANTYWQIFFSSLIQISLLYYVIRRLATPFLNEKSAGYALLISLLILLWASKDVSPYYQALILNWHFGTYLAGLYYLLFYVDQIAGKRLLDQRPTPTASKRVVIGLCILSFLTTLSDALFLMLFPCPLLLIGSYYLAIKKVCLKSYVAWFALPFLASLLGHYAAPLIVPNFGNLSLPLTSIDNIIPKLLEVYKLLSGNGISSLIIALFFGGCLWFLLSGLRGYARRGESHQTASLRLFLTLFVTVSLCTSLVIILVSSALVGDRYLPSLFFSPFVFLLLLSPSLFQKTGLMRTAQLILLATYLQNSWSHHNLSLKADYYPEQIACIDSATRQLSHPSGIGEYWLTKKLVAFSKTGVRMVSVNPDLTPYEVLISNDWYKDNYNFAIINTAEPARSMYLLSEKLIEDFNGKPDSIAFCKDAKILVYERGLSTTMDPERGSGVYSVEGCRLPRSTGTINQANACSLKSSSTGYAGNLSYGPYLKLPEGKYEFDLNYISANPVAQQIGHIDISFLFPEAHQIIFEKVLMGSGGNQGHLKGSLEIDQKQKRGQLEIRTFIQANSDIEILSINVTKIKSGSQGDGGNFN